MTPVDDGTVEWKAYAAAIAKRDALTAEMNALENAVQAKRKRFRESNRAAGEEEEEE